MELVLAIDNPRDSEPCILPMTRPMIAGRPETRPPSSSALSPQSDCQGSCRAGVTPNVLGGSSHLFLPPLDGH